MADRVAEIENCFDKQGNLKFDPYRVEPSDSKMYQILFDDYGFLQSDVIAITNHLVEENDWPDFCDARAFKFIQRHGSNTKGSYPPTYYWR